MRGYILKDRYFLPIFVVLLVLLLYPASFYQQEVSPSPEPLLPLADWQVHQEGKPLQSVRLPYIFSNLNAHTRITLTTTTTIRPKDYIMIKSVYAPFRLYVDDELIYESGQPGSYPDFFLDPPTQICLLPLPEQDKPVTLQLEYDSPNQRSELTVPLISMGARPELMAPLFQQNVLSYLFSLSLLILSLLLIMASVLLHEQGLSQAFLQLGLFSISVSIWSFSECNLTSIVFPYPSLWYLLSFLGLFTCTMPLMKFGIQVLSLQHPGLLKVQVRIIQGSILTAMALQYTSVIGFAQSMYFFHMLLPLSLLIFSLQLGWASWRYGNSIAKEFALPMGILTFFSIMELINYRLRFTNTLSLFFQLGVFLFILSLGVLCVRFVQRTLKMKEEKKQLEFDLLLAARQTDVQRTQYEILTEHEKVLRQQRHDLRHQLIVLKCYSEQGNQEKLQQYINELTAKIPIEKELFLCQNFVVNSVALYYRSLARKQQIDITLLLTAIAKKNGTIQDSDLCIIIGNLLENAIEASMHLPADQRKITMTTHLRDNKLLIYMRNRYDGTYKQKDGKFYSRKRNGKGTGLSSVESVVQNYHGLAEFEPSSDQFITSLYLILE